MKCIKIAVAVAAVALVAACGGGGGGDAASGSTTGLWNGTTSNGRDVSALVLADGTTWAAYVGGGTLGFVRGTMNGAATDFNFTAGTISTGTITGTATTKQSIAGSAVLAGGGTVTYTGTYDAAFEQTPTLAAVAGTYTGIGPSAGTTVTVAAGGGITGAVAGCNFTGTAAPRTDANAYDISVTFGGGACALGTQTLAGIAYYDATDRGLTAAGVNGANNAAFIFLGQKP